MLLGMTENRGGENIRDNDIGGTESVLCPCCQAVPCCHDRIISEVKGNNYKL